jgi:hypothetical protein
MVANVAEAAEDVDFFLRAFCAAMRSFSAGKIAGESLPGKTVEAARSLTL